MITLEREDIMISTSTGTAGNSGYKTAFVPTKSYVQIRTTWSFPYVDALARITDLGNLNPGWDSHGAAPIADAARAAAADFLSRLAHDFDAKVKEPMVGPLSDGSVALVWYVPTQAGQREVELVFAGDHFEYAVSDRDGVEPTISSDTSNPDELLQVVASYLLS
jgi:hypothetical protein